MHQWDQGALRPWDIETMGLWDYEILAHDNFGPYDYMAKWTLVCLLKDFCIWKDTHGPNLAVYYDKNNYTNAVEGILNSNARQVCIQTSKIIKQELQSWVGNKGLLLSIVFRTS